MSRYITSIDPCDHLQTTSAALNHLDYLDTIPTLDNLQYHLYEEENLLINEQVRLDRRFLDDLENASIINGEYGTRDGADTPSDMQRHILWNGIMTQVPRYMWVWDHYMDPSWAGLFTPPAEFLEGEDLALHGGPSRYDFLVEHPTRTFRSLGITGDSAFYGYVYDPANGRNHAGTTVTLDSLPVGRYTFTCFGAILGDVLSEDTLDLIRETHELDLPEFNKGIAFKLKYYADYDLPLARAGRDTVVALGTPAYLSGAASRSPGGQPLSFRWTLDERPEGSQAELENPESMEAVLTPDLAGMYLLSLVVSDAQDTSEADQVVVRGSTPPVALAGPDSTVSVKEDYVRLDGSGSFDPDGDELSYEWVLVSAPDSSEKLIYSEEKFLVILKTDVEGIFVLELTVSDGTSESAPDTAVVTVVGEGTGTGPGDPSALETLEDRVRIYPNPGNGTFYLSFPEGEEIRLLEVLGMDGRVLLQSRPGQQAAAPLELRLEKSGRGSGMLIIRLTGTRGISYHKVIIQ
jgi:hypothetical protein